MKKFIILCVCLVFAMAVLAVGCFAKRGELPKATAVEAKPAEPEKRAEEAKAEEVKPAEPEKKAEEGKGN